MTLYHYTTIESARMIGRRGFLRPLNDLGIPANAMSWWGALLWLTDLDAVTDFKAFGVDPMRLDRRYLVDATAARALPWQQCPMREALAHAPTYGNQLAEFERGKDVARWFVTGAAVLADLDRRYVVGFDTKAAQKALGQSVEFGGRAEGYQQLRVFMREQQIGRKTADAAAKRDA